MSIFEIVVVVFLPYISVLLYKLNDKLYYIKRYLHKCHCRDEDKKTLVLSKKNIDIHEK